MINLNNLEEIKKLDPKNVYGSTEMFTDQLSQMAEFFSFELPLEYKNIKNIVVCGMGGSAYGGHIALSLYSSEFRMPLLLNSDYHIPEFVNEQTLVILASYSGSTEEIISCAEEAKKRGAKLTYLTTGGELESLNNIQGIKFEPKFNPSAQPRLGTGYMVLGILIILNKVGAIELSSNEVNAAITEVKTSQEKIKSRAKELANLLVNSIPVIFAGEHLIGNAHIMRNQFNETSKSFAAYSPLPELNHHLMEGLKYPKNKNLHILFLDSDLYSEKIKKRLELTKDVVSKNGVPYSEYIPEGNSKLSQTLEVLSFGGYLTLYLGLLYGQDPSLIPWVDYFKEKLK